MTVIHGDSLEILKTYEDDSIDSMITDPPAGIAFMGKKWDTADLFQVQMRAIFQECLRVLKPGAHGFVWAFPRTSHWTATVLEEAGFEIRDVVTHVFGTGFPKNHNIGNGRGTALKPASEHWLLVRKPLGESTIAKNVLKYGTGAINIDELRIGSGAKKWDTPKGGIWKTDGEKEATCIDNPLGRFPANFMLSHHEDCGEECHPDCPVAELDRQSGVCSPGGWGHVKTTGFGSFGGGKSEPTGKRINGTAGGASRFFYCAKPGKIEKNAGAINTHSTVKPTKLMRYLITLITPPGGLVLDPFTGSGTTGVAAVETNREFVGIEREQEYVKIADARIKQASKEAEQNVLW